MYRRSKCWQRTFHHLTRREKKGVGGIAIQSFQSIWRMKQSLAVSLFIHDIYIPISPSSSYSVYTHRKASHTHTHTFVLFISINTEAQYQWQTREQSNIIRRYTHPYKDLFLKINKCIYSTYIRFVLRLVYMCAGCCESSLFPGYFSYIGNRFPFFKRKRNVPR